MVRVCACTHPGVKLYRCFVEWVIVLFQRLWMSYELSRLDFVDRPLPWGRLRQAPHISLLDLCHTHQINCGTHQTHVAETCSTACSTVTTSRWTAGTRSPCVGSGHRGGSGCWQDIVALGRSLLPGLDVVLDGFEHDVGCQECTVDGIIN